MVATGPDMAYTSSELMSGASRARSAASAAEAALAALRRVTVRALAFGDFDGAARLATGLDAVRDDHARMAHDVHARHMRLDSAAQRTAALGTQLVTDTTGRARAVTPGSITAGMQG